MLYKYNKDNQLVNVTSNYCGKSFATKFMRKIGLKKNKVQPELLHKLKQGTSDDVRNVLADHSEKGKYVSIVAKPYNSSKVCFDLIPQYADETCGPTNARHKKDGASFAKPNLWYKIDLYQSNKRYAHQMVQKDRVKHYVECVNRYVTFLESCDIQTVNNMIQGLNNGYRGLELVGHSRSRRSERLRYVHDVVEFANETKDDPSESNDIDLCVYSENMTHWNCVVANRLAQMDAVAAFTG